MRATETQKLGAHHCNILYAGTQTQLILAIVHRVHFYKLYSKMQFITQVSIHSITVNAISQYKFF